MKELIRPTMKLVLGQRFITEEPRERHTSSCWRRACWAVCGEVLTTARDGHLPNAELYDRKLRILM